MAPRITLAIGDLAAQACDAIVNAANEALAGGGGVDGAIHRAAGPELLAACRALPTVPGTLVRCPTGEARVTPAFGRLQARWVIHAVGPVHGVPGDTVLLRRAFDAAFDAAVRCGARTVAAPALSCGAFRFPLDAAAGIAVASALVPRDLDAIHFVLFDAKTHAAWQRALDL